MRKSVLALLVLGLAAGLGSTPALAGFNAGASYIDSSVDVNESGFGFDADNSSFKVFAGFTFLKWLGVEAQYTDLGTFEDDVMGMKTEIDVKTYDIFAKLGFEFWRVHIFGKAGYSWQSGDIDTSSTSGIEDSISESDFAYGVGAAIRVFSIIWVRAEYEVYTVDEADVNVGSLGVDFRFGTNK